MQRGHDKRISPSHGDQAELLLESGTWTKIYVADEQELKKEKREENCFVSSKSPRMEYSQYMGKKDGQQIWNEESLDEAVDSG